MHECSLMQTIKQVPETVFNILGDRVHDISENEAITRGRGSRR